MMTNQAAPLTDEYISESKAESHLLITWQIMTESHEELFSAGH